MFNSVAFDVVIGLVFVYLLYSLFVTILGEIVMTKLDVRARLLRQAIERMLNDGYYDKSPQNKIHQSRSDKFFMREHKMFGDSFAGRFYEQPAIKYLTKLDKKRPSYISAETFADTVISLLICASGGNDKPINTSNIKDGLTKAGGKISPLVEAAMGIRIQANTYDHIVTLLRKAEDLATLNAAPMSSPPVQSPPSSIPDNKVVDEFRKQLMKWFDETMDRANGWFKEKLRAILFVLGFFIAVAFNVDSIKIASMLGKDKDARAQLVQMGTAMAKDSLRYQPYTSAGGDTLHSQAIIDSGYSRVTKDLQSANKALGLGWDFDNLSKGDEFTLYAGNAHYASDSTAIMLLMKLRPHLKLLQDSIKSANIFEDASSIKLKASYSDTTRLSAQKKNIDGYVKMYLSARDTPNAKAQSAIGDSLSRKIMVINDSAVGVLQRFDSARLDLQYDSLALKNDSTAKYAAMADSITEHEFIAIDSAVAKGKAITIYGRRHYHMHELIPVFISRIFSLSFFGFIITALAVSLGAPFWFDLLKKLVSIRGSGVKPEEKEVKK